MDSNIISSQEKTNLWMDYEAKNIDKKNVDIKNKSLNKNSKNELGKDAFLTLLMTQMKHQDPLNPVEDTEFLAQLAQFSGLEQMQNMNKTVTQVQTYNMMGKYVQGENYNQEINGSEVVEGIVDGVKIREDQAYLIIGEKELETEKVQNIYDQIPPKTEG